MTWKTTKNDGFLTVFWSFWVLDPILAHQTAKFKLSGQFRFSRHPWGPWGRQSSGVIGIWKIYHLFCDSALSSLSAESQDNLTVTSGTINAQTRNHSQGPPPTNNNSNLKGSKKISRSISLLAPWKPRPELKRDLEINYDNGNLYANPATRVTVQPGNMPPAAAANASSKPPRPPTAPPPPPPSTVRRNQSATRRGVVDHNSKSASSSDLLRDDPIDHSSEDTTPAVILAERKAAQTEAEKRAAKVSRSMSMPKDSRLAGWFKKRKRIAW